MAVVAAGREDADRGLPENRDPDHRGQGPDHLDHRVLQGQDQDRPEVGHRAPDLLVLPGRRDRLEAAVQKSRLPAPLRRRPT